MQMMSGGGGGGGATGIAGSFRVAFSSGQLLRTDAATQSHKYVTRTTQFVRGHQISRKETTTIFPDGKREIIVEEITSGSGATDAKTTRKEIQRFYYEPPTPSEPMSSAATTTTTSQSATTSLPWYLKAWKGLSEKLAMCYGSGPNCGTTVYAQ
jgi:hypothetical protein